MPGSVAAGASVFSTGASVFSSRSVSSELVFSCSVALSSSSEAYDALLSGVVALSSAVSAVSVGCEDAQPFRTSKRQRAVTNMISFFIKSS